MPKIPGSTGQNKKKTVTIALEHEGTSLHHLLMTLKLKVATALELTYSVTLYKLI